VENDTVDLVGGVYAYTAMDIFSKEPRASLLKLNLEMAAGAVAFAYYNEFYGSIELQPVR